VNPDTIGYVWTGEFDLNTLRVDGEIFVSGKKKLRIQKHPDTCGRGLSLCNVLQPIRMKMSVQPIKYTRLTQHCFDILDESFRPSRRINTQERCLKFFSK